MSYSRIGPKYAKEIQRHAIFFIQNISLKLRVLATKVSLHIV